MTKLPPATGICRWLSDALNGCRRLEINGQAYEIEQLTGGLNLHRVNDRGEITRYHVNTSLPCGVWTCSCPDATNRPERRCQCKHVRALRAALQALPT